MSEGRRASSFEGCRRRNRYRVWASKPWRNKMINERKNEGEIEEVNHSKEGR